ncbi:MAG: nucleotidyltransferase family protein [Bacteroidales bacterium]|nr:nucleotidyltransferase family protein [Bacteroidales bacterium]
MGKALILAAGLGTRLRPLTDHCPKALIEVEGATLLEHALIHLKSYGFNEVIINVHHFSGMIRDFLHKHHNFGLKISFSDESGELLETGGGLKKAAWFFDDGSPFLVRNVDILSDLNLTCLFQSHLDSGALATLVVKERPTSRYLLFDRDLRLSGWENQSSGEKKITRSCAEYQSFAFSGIQIISPSIFPLITEQGRFSLIDLYLRLSARHAISGWVDNTSLWRDAGKLKR